jgi:hypothetical protein
MDFNFNKMNPFGNKEKKDKMKQEGDVNVLEPVEQKKKAELLKTTEMEVEETKELITPEKLIKITPEKRKIIIDKVKALLVLVAAAGIVLTVENWGAMEKTPDFLSNAADASSAAVKEGAGVLLVVLGSIGVKIRDIYNKVKPEKI